MNNDLVLGTKQGVFKILCPKCNIESFVGFECSDETFQESSYGLMSFARRRDELIDTNAIPDWIHCPACDESLGGDEYDLNDFITDITKPQS